MTRYVLIIAGPPCAGKSTLARQLATPGDLIVDRDTIAIQLGLGTNRQRSNTANRQAETAYRNQLTRIAGSEDITAYVVRSLPYATQRRGLATYLDAQVRILDPGIDECLRRARADNRPTITEHWIRQWYRQYQPDRPKRITRANELNVDLENI